MEFTAPNRRAERPTRTEKYGTSRAKFRRLSVLKWQGLLLVKHLPALEVIQVSMTHKQLKALARHKRIVKKRNVNHNKAKEQRKVLFMPGANKSYRLYNIR